MFVQTWLRAPRRSRHRRCDRSTARRLADDSQHDHSDCPLSSDDVAERSTRHRLTLAYARGQLIGNATVRPPHEPDAVATVIVRVLPQHRRQGHGSTYLHAELAKAQAIDARRIETVIVESNADGLAFAQARGFVEHDRYIFDTIAFIDMHLLTGLDGQ